MVTPDDVWLCQQNIERFRKQHADVTDDRQRARLAGLIAEEQAKLDRLAEKREPR